MARLYRVSGAAEEILPAAPAEGFSLTELYALVGCAVVQIVGLGDGTALVIDEEGKLAGKPLNPMATALAAHRLFPGDMIVGDALLVFRGEVQ